MWCQDKGQWPLMASMSVWVSLHRWAARTPSQVSSCSSLCGTEPLTAPIPPTSLRTVLLKVLNTAWSVWHCQVTQADNKGLLSQALQYASSSTLHPCLKPHLFSGSLKAYSCKCFPLMLSVENCISFLFKSTSFLGRNSLNRATKHNRLQGGSGLLYCLAYFRGRGNISGM